MQGLKIPCAVLAGGVGAAKFAAGLATVVDAPGLAFVGNTGDDIESHGLRVSPDIDTLLYTLAGIANPESGWGVCDDTFETLAALDRLGEETWFRVGDRDFATHLFRTGLLREGLSPSAVTRRIADGLGVRSAVLPMTDADVRTFVTTPTGDLPFQEFFVKHACKPDIRGVRFDGASSASPSPDVVRAIESATLILIAPSNPVASIGPILALNGMREMLLRVTAPRVAVSPLVGGKSLKGPSDRMMRALGFRSDAFGVAEYYRGLIDGIVIDREDESLRDDIESMDISVLVTDTLMTSADRKTALARETVEWAMTLHDQHRHSRKKPVLR